MSERTGPCDASGSDNGPKWRTRGAYALPELLAEIADVAGLPAALAVAQVKGGRRTHFPAKCPDDHWLVVAAGREAADKLCEHFRVNHKGGITLLVPLGPTKLYDRARFHALALMERGRSVNDVAREIGVSARSIEHWRAAERARIAAWRSGAGVRVPDGKVELDHAYPPVNDGLMLRLDPVAEADQDDARADRADDNAPPLLDIDPASLPTLLAEIASVAGIGAAIVLGRMKHGRVMHFTNHAGRGAKLFSLVGRDSGEKLRAHFQGKHCGAVELLIPACPARATEEFCEWTLEMLTRGYAARDLAESTGLTPAIVEHVARVALAEVRSSKAFKRHFPHTMIDGER